MSKYALLARTFLNDKDVYDLLVSGKFSKQGLLRYLRGWGIFLSHHEDFADIARYVSSMSLGWDDVHALVAQCDSKDRVPKRATKRIKGAWDEGQLDKIISDAKKALTEDGRQTWRKTKSGKTTIIAIKAILTDHSLAKFGQRTEISTQIEIEQTSEGYVVRSDQIEESAAAANTIYQLLVENSKKPTKQEKIELTGVRDPILRSEFFLKLHRLKDYRVLDTLDVKIDRRLPNIEDNSETEEGNSEDNAQSEEEIKGLVKNAALSGNNLLTSDLYNRLRETGFYIYALTWTAIEKGTNGRKVDFEAGFGKPVEALNFAFSVKRVHLNTQENEAGKTLGEILRIEGPKHTKAVELAAYDALEHVLKKLEKK